MGSPKKSRQKPKAPRSTLQRPTLQRPKPSESHSPTPHGHDPESQGLEPGASPQSQGLHGNHQRIFIDRSQIQPAPLLNTGSSLNTGSPSPDRPSPDRLSPDRPTGRLTHGETSGETSPQVVLTPDQRHYLVTVLRLGTQDGVIAQTQDGDRWLAQVNPGGDRLTLTQALPPLPPEILETILLAAVPKTGFDEVVRQATELGVGTIVPVLSQRTLPQPSAQKIDRWQRIAQEAAEQCERRQVPRVTQPQPFSIALGQVPANSLRYLCVARGDAIDRIRSAPAMTPAMTPALDVQNQGTTLKDQATKDQATKPGLTPASRLAPGADLDPRSTREPPLNQNPPPETPPHSPPLLPLALQFHQDLNRYPPITATRESPQGQTHPPVVLVIGPEGGWTDGELGQALGFGYVPVSLGSRILRAVTAPLVALTLVAAVAEANSIPLGFPGVGTGGTGSHH